MKYFVYTKGPADTKYHIAAMFNTRADAEQYMAEFLADRPGFVAYVEIW
jgi:hypothetical protein